MVPNYLATPGVQPPSCQHSCHVCGCPQQCICLILVPLYIFWTEIVFLWWWIYHHKICKSVPQCFYHTLPRYIRGCNKEAGSHAEGRHRKQGVRPTSAPLSHNFALHTHQNITLVKWPYTRSHQLLNVLKPQAQGCLCIKN